MEAINLSRTQKWNQTKVGSEQDGSSSNRSELTAFVLALCNNPACDKVHAQFYLCVNHALLRAVKRWTVKGGKVTLAGSKTLTFYWKQ